MNFKFPDSHGWFSIGLFALTVLCIVLMASYPDLRKDDLFKMVVQGVVLTGLINLAASFYYGASKAKSDKVDQEPNP